MFYAAAILFDFISFYLFVHFFFTWILLSGSSGILFFYPLIYLSFYFIFNFILFTWIFLRGSIGILFFCGTDFGQDACLFQHCVELFECVCVEGGSSVGFSYL
jgi:hypothetical protein